MIIQQEKSNPSRKNEVFSRNYPDEDNNHHKIYVERADGDGQVRGPLGLEDPQVRKYIQ